MGQASNSVLEESADKSGFGYDGFTYFKPEILSYTKDAQIESSCENEARLMEKAINEEKILEQL